MSDKTEYLVRARRPTKLYGRKVPIGYPLASGSCRAEDLEFCRRTLIPGSHWELVTKEQVAGNQAAVKQAREDVAAIAALVATASRIAGEVHDIAAAYEGEAEGGNLTHLARSASERVARLAGTDEPTGEVDEDGSPVTRQRDGIIDVAYRAADLAAAHLAAHQPDRAQAFAAKVAGLKAQADQLLAEVADCKVDAEARAEVVVDTGEGKGGDDGPPALETVNGIGPKTAEAIAALGIKDAHQLRAVLAAGSDQDHAKLDAIDGVNAAARAAWLEQLDADEGGSGEED